MQVKNNHASPTLPPLLLPILEHDHKRGWVFCSAVALQQWWWHGWRGSVVAQRREWEASLWVTKSFLRSDYRPKGARAGEMEIKKKKLENGWCVISSGRKEETKSWELRVEFVGKAWFAFLQCLGRHEFKELFCKWGRLNLRNAWPRHQFLLKPKHSPKFSLELHWNEGQLQMDSTLYFAHFLAWGCRTAWIKTCGFRSSYSKSRPKKRMLIGKHHGRGWQHPLLSCLGRVPSGCWFPSDASRAPEPNIYPFENLAIFHSFPKLPMAVFSPLWCSSPNSAPCHVPMLAFSICMFFHSY